MWIVGFDSFKLFRPCSHMRLNFARVIDCLNGSNPAKEFGILSKNKAWMWWVKWKFRRVFRLFQYEAGYFNISAVLIYKNQLCSMDKIENPLPSKSHATLNLRSDVVVYLSARMKDSGAVGRKDLTRSYLSCHSFCRPRTLHIHRPASPRELTWRSHYSCHIDSSSTVSFRM
jgi:hypothetical protein